MGVGDPHVGSLNLLNPRDRGLLRRACDGSGAHRARWPITPEFRQEAVIALQAAMNACQVTHDASGVNDCVRTLAALERMNQEDEHLQAKMQAISPDLPEVVATEYRVEFDSGPVKSPEAEKKGSD